MPRCSRETNPDLSSCERPRERVFAGNSPHRPWIATPPDVEELQRLLSATIAEKGNLVARVRALEAELRGRSAELAELRGELRGARHDALRDPLTGLANRRAFDLELGALAARASGSSLAQLLMVDIDHFKRVNDTHGHDVGDQVLRVVGELLLANVRRDSVVARLGGDEFALLLPRARLHYAAGIATRLRGLVASRPLVERGRLEVVERVTLSIGVAGRQAGESSAEWYARADAALYRAKRRGRNGVAIDTRWPAASRALPAKASETRCPADRG